MKRGDTVRIRSGWMTGALGCVETVEGGHAVVLVHGSGFPFPRCERIDIAHLERIDLSAQRDRAARESVGEAPF